MSLENIKSAHFTVCQKPWNCEKNVQTPTRKKINGKMTDIWVKNELCMELHRSWFELRREAENFYGLQSIKTACPKGGKQNCIPMKLDQVKLDSEVMKKYHVIKDDSLDRYDPIETAKYMGHSYD